MLWDPIRLLWVKATPEEEVRQKLIQRMISELGFPKGLIGVEKDLASLVEKMDVDPNRRIDLICYTPVKEKIVPLLIAECKAQGIGKDAENQVLGYNEAIGAPFICLANAKEVKTLWREPGKIASVPFLPTYAQLVEKRCLFF